MTVSTERVQTNVMDVTATRSTMDILGHDLHCRHSGGHFGGGAGDLPEEEAPVSP